LEHYNQWDLNRISEIDNESSGLILGEYYTKIYCKRLKIYILILPFSNPNLINNIIAKIRHTAR
jgi:hypothetical protein